MLEIAGQIILCLLIVAIIGFILGYLLGRASCSDDSNCHTVTHHDDEAGVKPNFLSEPIGGEKDNLQLIKGVGATIEKKLNELGVYHYEQIASWGMSEMVWIDKYLAFPGRAQRENWVEQAKILASGTKTEFAKRVEQGEVPTSHA